MSLMVMGVLFAGFFLTLIFLLLIKKKPGTKINYYHEPDSLLPEKNQSTTVDMEIGYSDLPVNFQPKDYVSIDKAFQAAAVKTIAKIDTMPSSLFKVLNSLDSTDTSSQDVASIIATDPVLSGVILKTVNSAYFNLPNKISSLTSAILFLGFNNVKSIAIQQSLKKSFSRTGIISKQSMNHLWIHSSAVSACAFYLGKTVLKCHEGDLATIGLLHDIGKYFLRFVNHDQDQPDIVSIAEEEKIFGINHALLGSMVAKHWGLPEVIVDAIEFHHHPVYFPPDWIAEPFDKLSFIICLSDLIASSLGDSYKIADIYPIRQEYFSRYDIPDNISSFVTQELLKEVKKSTATVEAYMNF